jgi:putative autoinducer-2 (AI-2) aldolase
MDWGMENRLSRIIRPDTGRCVMLAVDHGYFQGPTSGLEDLGRTVEPLLPYADALMLTRGALRNCVEPANAPPIVLRMSGGNSMVRRDELSDETITVAVEDAIRLNAAAITLSVYVGSPHQKATIANLSKLVDAGERYGIPVLAVTAVGAEMVRDARYLGLACRIAAEIGAHFVKTYYCEPAFEDVVQGCPVPVVVAGGKKLPERDALALAWKSVRGGAVGVDMGRNIFQSEWPVAMIRAVREIVHKNATVDEAWAIVAEAQGAKP